MSISLLLGEGNRLMFFFTKGKLWAGGCTFAVSVSFSLLLDDV